MPSEPKIAKSKLPKSVQAAELNTARGAIAPKALAPGLYLIATPIGNLGDITLRALQCLAACDVIACEDSRATARLLQHYGIKVPRISYHEHSPPAAREAILARLAGGARVGLVSDAGTPLISDPGYKLVRAAIAQGANVSGLPGPSAPLMALILSGLPSDRFLFHGFLPPKGAARRTVLAELANLDASLIFFESARRLPQSLCDMAQILGHRPAAVARELTKLFEEIRRDALPALAGHYTQAGPPKGEVVVVIGPPLAGDKDRLAQEDELDALLRENLQKFRLKEAVAQAAATTGLPRKQVYARALALSGKLNTT